MADTYDKTIGGDDLMPSYDSGYVFTLRRRYNCKTVALGGEGNVTSGDTLQLINIPADTVVDAVSCIKHTVEGGTLTIDVGDGSDTDGWLDGANLNSATTERTALALAEAAPNTIVGYTSGKLYTAADTIDALFNNTADTADFELVAECRRIKKGADTSNVLGST